MESPPDDSEGTREQPPEPSATVDLPAAAPSPAPPPRPPEPVGGTAASDATVERPPDTEVEVCRPGRVTGVRPARESDATVDGPAPTPAQSAGTLDYPPRRPAGAATVQQPAPNGATVEQSVGSPGPDGTLDQKAVRAAGSADFSLAESIKAGVEDQHAVAGYDILGVLGRGAMGVVYRARQRGLKRIVALKMILAGGHASDTELARFRMEAEAVGQLQHPNITQVYDVGEQNGCPFLSMEFVDGGSLQGKLGGTPQPFLPAAQMVQVLAQAMAFAHGKGIVHRDLKPANVMLMKPRDSGNSESALSTAPLVEQVYGIPKIADFGLAKKLEEDGGQTRSGTILGTPSYMAPEQAEGRSKEVGGLADQYALGAILYEMLTGRPPFRGATVWETLDQVRTQEPVPPSRLQPKVPRDLETICLKCLQKEPLKRYADCAALAEDLRRFVAGEPIHARPVSALERTWRWCRRNPWLAGLAAAVVLLLVTVAVSSTVFAVQFAKQRDLAETNAGEALKAEKVAELAKQEADTARDQAETSAKVAGEQSDLAFETITDLLTKVQDRLANSSEHKLSEDLVKLAMDNLQKAATKLTKPGMTARAQAVGYLKMGDIFKKIGRTQDALKQYQWAYDVCKKEYRDHADSDLDRGNMAVAMERMGDIRLHLDNKLATALPYFQEALNLRRDILEHPCSDPKERISADEVRLSLVPLYIYVGDLTPDPVAKRGRYREALATIHDWTPQAAEYRQRRAQLLADCYLNLGEVSFQLHDFAAVQSYYDKCAAEWRGLLAEQSDQRDWQQAAAYVEEKLGDFLVRSGDGKGALARYGTALTAYEKLAKADPQDVFYKDCVARAQDGIGAAELRLGNRPRAALAFAEALKLRQAHVAIDPDGAPPQKTLMRSLARCGRHADAARIAARFRKEGADDPGTLFEVACCYALCADAVAPGKPADELSAAEAGQRRLYATRAVEALRAAVAHGYMDVVEIETTPELDPVRGAPAFQDALHGLKRPPTAAGKNS